MNDTPETDEQINGKPCTRFEVIVGNSLRDAWVPSEFARKLERERDRYKSDVEVITKERDEARGALRSFVQKMRDQAAVFKREDLRDNSRWSIFNEGRAQALEKFAEDLETAK